MTQEKVSKEETADLVKIIQAINPGNLLKALEIGLQSLNRCRDIYNIRGNPI